MPGTRTDRRALVAGLVCVVVLIGVAVVLDQHGVRPASNLVVMLVASSVILTVVLLARRRSR